MTIRSFLRNPVNYLGKQAVDRFIKGWWRFESGAESFAQSLYLRRLFEKYEVDAVFDVGASGGEYRDFLRNNVGFKGVIFSFEPLPDMVRLMKSRAKDDHKWHIIECALGREQGTMAFNRTQSVQFSSFLQPKHDDVDMFARYNKVSDIVDVKVDTISRTFDDMRKICPFRHPYLKVDTQGFDLEVLRGAGDKIREFIALQTEVGFRNIYEGAPGIDETLQEMRRCGFVLRLPRKIASFQRDQNPIQGC